ncbi:hypothetical protein LK533_02055 [Sphingomonas sp. PL-96]|uniref:hypothetical protein n=1 Tax=Sphingomonas sp. PL-96 TaxID=2887201 RepID=UPI001E331554|nr:hypothetical protein [Sphingomonas sp. PL-96]MCC2975455.1 hypothetical protein [Sphingomonas sp. PL-96]
MQTASKQMGWIGVAALASLPPAPALACTLCHSPQAVSVRERLLSPDLWWNACAVVLPLLFLLALVALVLREPGERSQP